MDARFREALGTGYERLSAWADLLDRINVFPVADGDTGRNLVVSLAPLRRTDLDRETLVRSLLLSARGNSGNIGARFIEGFVAEEGAAPLRERARRGRDLAWAAVADPKPGTMLSLFDAFVGALGEASVDLDPHALAELLDRLEQAVHDTRGQLAELRRAGVVDAGALGMFLFFEGFLARLCDQPPAARDVAERFRDAVAFAPRDAAPADTGFCIDAVLEGGAIPDEALQGLSRDGASVVSIRQGGYVKVHLHADDQTRLRQRLEQLGRVVRWTADDLGAQTAEFVRPPTGQVIHVMTDAAGSLTRDEARRLGITLLDSYVSLGELSVPETRLPPDELYAAMCAGAKVSTSQASVFERHQHYEKVLKLHRRVLYLCVGSVYTGNHAVANEWKKAHDADERMIVLDTGAASGRLGLLARAVACRAQSAGSAEEVIDYARRAVPACGEWIFLDRLHWLAVGGRLSRTSAFFGDLLRVKPVVSPTAEGAKKVAVVRGEGDQVDFAVARLRETLGPAGRGTILLEHSDNRVRLEQAVRPVLQSAFPAAEILLQPLSNTSGAHMGPGTWAVAALPAEV